MPIVVIQMGEGVGAAIQGTQHVEFRVVFRWKLILTKPHYIFVF